MTNKMMTLSEKVVIRENSRVKRIRKNRAKHRKRNPRMKKMAIKACLSKKGVTGFHFFYLLF